MRGVLFHCQYHQTYRLGLHMFRLSMLLGLLFMHSAVQAINLSMTDWHYLENDFQSLTVAGDYYDTSFESQPSVATMSVGAAPGTPISNNTECGGTNPAWKVSVWLSTSVDDLNIQIKRVNNGSGGSVVGGESYITLNAAAQTFFCGSGDINNIGLQFMISDLGVADGNGTDIWKIRYRVETL